MRQLRIHCRPSDVTSPRLDELKAALAAHPGVDDVVMVIRNQRLRLGVSVDATSRPAVREIALSFIPASVIVVDDTVDAF